MLANIAAAALYFGIGFLLGYSLAVLVQKIGAMLVAADKAQRLREEAEGYGEWSDPEKQTAG